MFQRKLTPRIYRLLPLMGFLSLLAALNLSAETSYSVDSPDFDRDFILAGDVQDPPRDGVQVTMSADISTDSDSTEEREHRFLWELQVQEDDGTWSVVPLKNNDNDLHATDAISVDVAENSTETISAIESFETENELDPYKNYRVRGWLQVWSSNGFIHTWSNVDDAQNGPSGGQNLYQFTNTQSGDDPVNVISTLDSVSLSNPFLLDDAEDSAKRGFTVDFEATARRWDEYEESVESDDIRFEYEIELREKSTGETIPLEQTTFSDTRSIDTYMLVYNGSIITKYPNTKTFDETLTIIPAEQLDPVNEEYEVEVTISHEENPVTEDFKTGNVREIKDQKLYHFNSALAFGSIDAVLRDFVRDPQPSASSGSDYVEFELDGLAGHLASSSGHTFDAADPVTVRLFADGSAAVDGVTNPVEVTPPDSPDHDSVADVRFTRENLTLDTSGLTGDLTVRLPQGMGHSSSNTSRMLNNNLNFSGESFNNGLAPDAGSLTYAPSGTLWVTEETKPARIAASGIEWRIEAGDFDLINPGSAQSVRFTENDFLRNSPAPEEQKIKPDNSGYYHFVKSTDGSAKVATADDGSAKLSTSLSFGDGTAGFVTHFPAGAFVAFQGGSLKVAKDTITAGQLDNVEALELSYDQGCSDIDCPQGEVPEGTFVVDVGTLDITADGGLIGHGTLENSGDKDLSWGFIENDSNGDPVYAHSLSSFSEGTFHSSGHFIPGEGGQLGDFESGAAGQLANNGPGNILLAAADQDNPDNVARPGDEADKSGALEYAGVNLDAGDEGNIAALAHIAGDPYTYDLRDCNKFYVRKGGVTGTLEAEPDSFPEDLELYGYDFQIDYFGYGFLDSRTSPNRSFTEGSVSVPAPSDETFEFDGLALNCLGGLDSARLPDGGLSKELRYWAADIEVASLDFVPTDGCDPSSDAFAVLGLSAYSTLVTEPLHGSVGIRPNGELVHREFSRTEDLETEVTSRLRLPNRVRVHGPEDEKYELTAVSEAYFNHHAATSEQQDGDGRLNFAATIDVPFFRDLEAHVRTTASKDSNPDAVLDLMGGWTEDGETYFTASFFDSTNRAFPDGVDERTYRNESGAPGDPKPYLIHARQTWLDVVEFDYPLDWSSTLRSFEAYESSQDEDLLIVEVDHQLEYLSAENAEISFGVIYEGMPRINLTSFAFNKIDEGTGTLQAATDALQEEAVGALEGGLDSMDGLLSDRIDALVDEFLDGAVDPVVDDLYDSLKNAADSTSDVNQWKSEVEDNTKTYISGVVGQADNLRAVLKDASDNVDDASSLIQRIDDRLEEVQIALRTVHDEIYRVSDGVSLDKPSSIDEEDIIQGLLQPDEDGEYPIVEALVSALLEELSGEIGDELAAALDDLLEEPTGALNDLINEQLDKVEPTLDHLREVIAELDTRIGEVREQLDSNGEFLAELQSIIDAADTQIEDATEEVQQTVEDFIIADIPEPDFFEEYSKEEIKQRIRDEISDKMREMDFLREYQQVLRQKLYDLDLAIKEGIDSAFAQVNTTLKDLVGEYLTQVDDEINGFLGDLDEVLGAGEIDGFAHINGDALRLLRLDAYLQMKVPDDLEFNGYLQIKQLESDGTKGCSYGEVGELATEVTMGAAGVPADWLSPGMALDVDGKVTFSNKPLGLGGAIEMVEGEFDFEAFTVTDLGAAMSFGETENYLAANVGLEFQSYTLAGGVFFGRTCDIAPLEMVNEQAASVLGEPDPTFTGAYVYGEAHIPVSEALLGIPASCMFRIDAGVGAGAFYFVEGPTYGGQMLLNASGEVICLVSVEAEISLVGTKVADDFRFNGQGRIAGKAGSCPLCTKFSKTLELEYKNNSWSYDL